MGGEGPATGPVNVTVFFRKREQAKKRGGG